MCKIKAGILPPKIITFCEGIFVVANKIYCDELNYLSLIPYYVNYLRWPRRSSQIISQLGKYIFLRRSIIVANV
jgi:hypothetical protein